MTQPLLTTVFAEDLPSPPEPDPRDVALKALVSSLNRRAEVEQVLYDVARGARDALSPDECRRLAMKLGVPDKYRAGDFDGIRLVGPRAPASTLPVHTFQARVRGWVVACFNENVARDIPERAARFCEESLELCQAAQMTAAQAHEMVDYVFGRPMGELAQEVGGVQTTLAALCCACDIDMDGAGEDELASVWEDMPRIRAKWLAKPRDSVLASSERVFAPLLHPRTENLLQRFAGALREKLATAERKRSCADEWRNIDWMDECRAELLRHIVKGDPRDVAAYAMFLWHHGERTAEPRRGVYLASRAHHAPMWQTLRTNGLEVSSSWIDEAGVGETDDFADLWARVAAEVQRSRCLVLYATADDFPLKGALVECGIAIAANVPVVVFSDATLEPRTDRPLGSWIRHPNVHLAASLDQALSIARTYC